MNKLVIGNEEEINDITVNEDLELSLSLFDSNREFSIFVAEGCCLKIVELSQNTVDKISIEIAKDAKVIVNKIAINSGDVWNISLNGERAYLKFSQSIINYTDHVNVKNIVHHAPYTKSEIINHGVNVEDRILHFFVNGTIDKNAKETEFHQDNKIINLKNGKSFIFPNLLVDEQEVSASHSAYIGNFSKDQLFYLQSRGISKKDSEKLLLKGFLYQDMDLTEDEHEKVERWIKNI